MKVLITGVNGMLGSNLLKLLPYETVGFTSKELDLRNQKDVFELIKKEKPYAIIDAAAKVGGILANDTFPYEFLMDNMLIQNNLIKAAHELDIQKLVEKLKKQKGIEIEHKVVQGANHFFDNKIDNLIEGIDSYLDYRISLGVK